MVFFRLTIAFLPRNGAYSHLSTKRQPHRGLQQLFLVCTHIADRIGQQEITLSRCWNAPKSPNEAGDLLHSEASRRRPKLSFLASIAESTSYGKTTKTSSTRPQNALSSYNLTECDYPSVLPPPCHISKEYFSPADPTRTKPQTGVAPTPHICTRSLLPLRALLLNRSFL